MKEGGTAQLVNIFPDLGCFPGKKSPNLCSDPPLPSEKIRFLLKGGEEGVSIQTRSFRFGKNLLFK